MNLVRVSLQRFALPSDSAEAVQPNQLYGHHPCLSPERAIFFKVGPIRSSVSLKMAEEG
jgi:hypothetical protein